MHKRDSLIVQNVTLKKAMLIYMLVSFFLIFEMALQVSPSVMASDLMKDLNMSAFSLGLMSGIYFYTYAGMQIPAGLLFDRFNPRMIITVSVCICSIGAIAFGLTTQFYLACLARLLMCLGSAFAFISVLVIASDLFQTRFFAILTCITQMLAALGAMLGQFPISMLVHQLGWHFTMCFLGCVGLVLAIAIWCLLDYKKNSSPFLPSSNTKEYRQIIQSLTQVLSKRQTWFIALYALLLWSPMSGFASLWGISFLMKFDGLTQSSAAFYSSMMWLGLAFGSPLLGLLSSITHNKVLPLIISAALGYFAFSLILEVQLTGICLGLLLMIAGAACAGQALSFSLVRDNNSADVKATAISFNNMAVVISGAIVQPLIGAIISFKNISLGSAYSLSDFKYGLLVILTGYGLSAFIALCLIKEKSKKSARFDAKFCGISS